MFLASDNRGLWLDAEDAGPLLTASPSPIARGVRRVFRQGHARTGGRDTSALQALRS